VGRTRRRCYRIDDKLHIFSLKNHGDVRGAYLEGLKLFFEEYIKATGDGEITGVVAPFYAFRPRLWPIQYSS